MVAPFIELPLSECSTTSRPGQFLGQAGLAQQQRRQFSRFGDVHFMSDDLAAVS
jgi:hypothetical protein